MHSNLLALNFNIVIIISYIVHVNADQKRIFGPGPRRGTPWIPRSALQDPEMGRVPLFFCDCLHATALFLSWLSPLHPTLALPFNSWVAFLFNSRFHSMERLAAAPRDGQVSWGPEVRTTWPWPGNHRSTFTGLEIKRVYNASGPRL